jgi:hypothetical protein
MPELKTIIEWFMSGNGRLAAGASLFLLMWLIQSVPKVKQWLDQDSGKLTSGRKKAAANVLLAMAPVAVALTQDKPLMEAFATAIVAATSASGIHSLGKSALGK